MRRPAAIAIAVAASAGVATAAWLWLWPRSPLRTTSTTTLVVRITDRATAVPVAARVLLWKGAEPLHLGNLDVYGARQGAAACPIAPGVIGSWDGLIVATGVGEIPIGADGCTPSPGIPYGRYHVWAWRGIEYERWEGDVELGADRGRVELAIPLERAWTPHGTLSADLHVHARASTDSNVPNPQRVVAQVAAGIQVIGLSDHDTSGDLDAEITELGLDPIVASIASNELSANRLHLGVYPVPVERGAPRGGGPDPATIQNATPAELFAIAHAFPGDPIVQVNHPRFRVTALFDGAGWNGVAWPPPFPLAFDAVEVLAGYSAANVPGDRRIDDSVRDFFTLTDHGHLVAPLGNSDTHDLNWVLDGTARSYVFVDDPGVRPFDERGFVAAIRARRVVATTGPWLDVEVATAERATPTVGPGQSLAAKGSVWVDVTVEQTRFVATEWIRITVGDATGPRLAQTIDVPAGARTHHWAGAVAIGDADTWLAVTADGDAALPLPQTGTYQRDKWKKPGVTPFAIAAPILIDAEATAGGSAATPTRCCRDRAAE
jgi:hypothetical protein